MSRLLLEKAGCWTAVTWSGTGCLQKSCLFLAWGVSHGEKRNEGLTTRYEGLRGEELGYGQKPVRLGAIGALGIRCLLYVVELCGRIVA